MRKARFCSGASSLAIAIEKLFGPIYLEGR